MIFFHEAQSAAILALTFDPLAMTGAGGTLFSFVD